MIALVHCVRQLGLQLLMADGLLRLLSMLEAGGLRHLCMAFQRRQSARQEGFSSAMRLL